MTHSIKVAQLGRRLGQILRQLAIDREITATAETYPTPDPDLLEATCLAHDLGHPPFGHAGEQALTAAVDDIIRAEMDPSERALEAKVLQAQQTFGGFEGNAQTFRLLVRLSARPPRHSKGLNLTRAVLDGTIKYPWLRCGDRKWNVYPDDKDVADWVRDGVPLGLGERKSFEAQVMDWCDDITYACHDMEDFYRAGLIPLHDLFAFPPENPDADPLPEISLPDETRRFLAFVQKKWTDAGRSFDLERSAECWRSLGQMLLISEPYQGSRANKAELHRGISQVITYFLKEIKWKKNGVVWDGMPYCHEGDLHIDDERRLICDLLQELIWYYVIERPALASQQYGQKRIVTELLRIFYDSPDLLPKDRKEELTEGSPALRVAADHVASLTDSGALALHQRLTGIHPGAHSDNVWRV